MNRAGLHQEEFETLSELLTPSKPVRDPAALRGRDVELNECVHRLTYGGAAPFIYGERGIGKTSLAVSSAQQVCTSDREPIYAACAPDMNFLDLMQEVLIELSDAALRLGVLEGKKLNKVEATLSLSPALKFTWQHRDSGSVEIVSASAAVRLVRDFDKVIPKPEQTVVVIDELENLSPDSKKDLAYFVKQIGDREVSLRFVYAGIAANIRDIIGEHESSPRYLHQIQLPPLSAQAVMDIASGAARSVGVEFPQDMLMRIAIVADGHPHFSHLMALHILTSSVRQGDRVVTEMNYKEGLTEAVKGSLEKLSEAYERATYRRSAIFERVLWVMAHSDLEIQKVDDIAQRYPGLARTLRWERSDEDDIGEALLKLRGKPFGSIIRNVTRNRGGRGKKVYRYVRFSESLMRAYVRLRAESQGVQLGDKKNVLPGV